MRDSRIAGRLMLLLCLLGLSIQAAESRGIEDLLPMLDSRNSLELLEAQDELVARGKSIVDPLLEQLRPGEKSSANGLSLEAQLNALTALSKIPDGRSIHLFEDLVRDPSADLKKRLFASMALKILCGPESESVLWQAYDAESSLELRAAILLSLGRIGGKETDRRFEHIALDTTLDPRLRALVVGCLGLYHRAAGQIILETLLPKKDTNPLLHQAVLYAAGRGDVFKLSEPLMQARHTLLDERRWFALALHTADKEAAIEPLKKLLSDVSISVRVFAALSLHQHGSASEECIKVLRKITQDRQANEDERADAVLALGMFPEAREYLIAQASKSPDIFVRMAALLALRHQDPVGNVEFLIRRITDESDVLVKGTAIQCAGEAIPPRLLKTLIQYASNGDAAIKGISNAALARLKLKETKSRRSHFLRLLGSRNPRDRELAGWCLALTGDDKALATLEKAATDDREFVALAVREAIASISQGRPNEAVQRHFQVRGLRNPDFYTSQGVYSRYGISLIKSIYTYCIGAQGPEAIKDAVTKTVKSYDDWDAASLGTMASIGLDPSDPRLNAPSGTFRHGNWTVWFTRGVVEEEVVDEAATYLQDLVAKKYNVDPWTQLQNYWLSDERLESQEETQRYQVEDAPSTP